MVTLIYKQYVYKLFYCKANIPRETIQSHSGAPVLPPGPLSEERMVHKCQYLAERPKFAPTFAIFSEYYKPNIKIVEKNVKPGSTDFPQSHGQDVQLEYFCQHHLCQIAQEFYAEQYTAVRGFRQRPDLRLGQLLTYKLTDSDNPDMVQLSQLIHSAYQDNLRTNI